jgi:hypothetical protein
MTMAGSSGDGRYTTDITWTTHGVAHITDSDQLDDYAAKRLRPLLVDDDAIAADAQEHRTVTA